MREKLAAYAHKTWTGWIRYMIANSRMNKDGSMTIPPRLVERWQRQMMTDYEGLSEAEKQSDRVEADRILAAVAALGANEEPITPGSGSAA